MTGGQAHDGPLSVMDITKQVGAEGAKKIFVVTDEPDKYDGLESFAAGTEIRHRSELDAVQRELRETPGLTVLVYDQACAAEKRRKRKRGLYPDPPKRIFINARVCEGCGDCSEKSNCVAVKPFETEFGRKRQIDQSDCNKDFSCLTGFCPSFVTVNGGVVRKVARPAVDVDGMFDALPMPDLPSLDSAYNILITGIGGTGVITVGALLGMAAHIEGKGCTILDFTGLAQKNGSVMSHIRLSPTPEGLHAVRIAAGEADALIGCDMLVAASPGALSRLDRQTTRAVVNDYLQPTAEFVRNTNLDFRIADVRRSLEKAVAGGPGFVNATGLATALMGDAIATNLFMLGFAWQSELIPLGIAAIEAAIELNGVAVDANKRTFAWGRLAAHDLGAVEAAAQPARRAVVDLAPALETLVNRRVEDLTRYHDAAYAERYRTIVGIATRAEAGFGGAGYALAVARNLYKVMAIKDEYEVARLYTDGEFHQQLEAQFEPGYRLEFNLAPPLFSRRDKATGELQKRSFGPVDDARFRDHCTVSQASWFLGRSVRLHRRAPHGAADPRRLYRIGRSDDGRARCRQSCGGDRIGRMAGHDPGLRPCEGSARRCRARRAAGAAGSVPQSGGDPGRGMTAAEPDVAVYPLPNFSTDLSGQVAVVTGASSGLGRRFAQVLAACGARVAVTGRRVDRLDELVSEIKAAGGEAAAYALDVTDPAQFVSVVDAVETALGPVSILINNAGVPDAQRAHKMPLDLIDRVFDTNLRAPYILSCEIARRMIAASTPGRIVNIASMAAFQYHGEGAALYCITKAGIVRMTEVLAVEWARYGINVNAIAPGSFSSEMVDGMVARLGDIASAFPRRRLGDPAQIDSTLLYLVSPASDFVTGAVIKIDDVQGGR